MITQTARRYKHNWRKRLRNNKVKAAIASQKVQSIKRQIHGGDWLSFEDQKGRAQTDRRGTRYELWSKGDKSIDIYYSIKGRYNQFDIIINTPKTYSDGLRTKKLYELSLSAILEHWKKL